MSHPNQLALAQAAEKWIEQSQALPDQVAIEHERAQSSESPND